MFASLKQPGGIVGTVTVVCAFFLFVAGIVGVVSGLTGLWSDSFSDNAYITGFAALNLLSVAGLVLQPRMPWPGALLVVPGAIAFPLAWFWLILPLVIGPTGIAVAVIRAVKLSRSAGARIPVAA
jgi:hypothetical protein